MKNLKEIERPKSVITISCLLIVFAVVGLAALFQALVEIAGSRTMTANPTFFISTALIGVFQLVIGVWMVRGHNWTRMALFYVFPVILIIGVVFGTANSASSMAGLKVFAYIACVFFLTRPDAVAYFKRSKK